ncbi:hypothetical protein CXG81DRAFT_20754 [Caulochytrium protostelioides]|uniref:Uncharacterized protein n=1 Tax=Caulochytrium protostelioides TaxID=1555241 RepID=A0A4P9X2R4_9FUNG|nr:hypothetical protein CXG81DRAFT_20754 [Caulochytrium protostelioides]|eukprot:RKO99130.1 hypothetical protein CXG81DRAFT_20754 [Caulochytrium protostelioides]
MAPAEAAVAPSAVAVVPCAVSPVAGCGEVLLRAVRRDGDIQPIGDRPGGEVSPRMGKAGGKNVGRRHDPEQAAAVIPQPNLARERVNHVRRHRKEAELHLRADRAVHVEAKEKLASMSTIARATSAHGDHADADRHCYDDDLAEHGHVVADKKEKREVRQDD